jgi:hypothetical protein
MKKNSQLLSSAALPSRLNKSFFESAKKAPKDDAGRVYLRASKPHLKTL